MVNLIPMAGLGSRFVSQGYKLPKPLIQVSGKPMVIQAAKDLPFSDNWIFVCRLEHIKDYNLDEILKKEFPHAIIIGIILLT